MMELKLESLNPDKVIGLKFGHDRKLSLDRTTIIVSVEIYLIEDKQWNIQREYEVKIQDYFASEFEKEVKRIETVGLENLRTEIKLMFKRFLEDRTPQI